MTDDGWIPGAADLYHLFLDRRMRADGGPGNGSQILLELDGCLDVEGLRERLDRAARGLPELRAGLWTWPRPRWRVVPGHRVPLTVDRSDDRAEELFDRHFARPFPPPATPSVELVARPGAERSLVVLRWLHPLMDAPGAAMALRLIDGDDPGRYRLRDQPPSLPRRARGRGRLRQAVAVHNFLLRYLLSSLPPPLQRPTRRGAPPRLLCHTFDAAQTRAIDRRAAALAGPLQTNHFLLGVAFRAAALALEPPRWSRLLIPCPVNLRPPAWRGPVFANYFTSVLVSLPASSLASLPAAVAAARGRFRRGLRRGEDAATFAMMSLVRWLPHALYSLLMQGPTLRDPASIYYSSVSLDAGRDGRFCGLPIRRCLAASHVLRPPGAALVFVRHGERLTLELSDRGHERAEELFRAARDLLVGGE